MRFSLVCLWFLWVSSGYGVQLGLDSENRLIGIPKEDVNNTHAYVLHSTSIKQRNAPMFESKKSYRVFFEKDDFRNDKEPHGSLTMFQSPQGQNVDYPGMKIPMGHFAVVRESEQFYYILFTSEGFGGEVESWFSAPEEGSNFHGPNVQRPQMYSRIRQVNISKAKDEFIIDYLSRDLAINVMILAQIPVQERILLKRLPSNEDRNRSAFQKKKGSHFKKVGYFETHPLIKPHEGRLYGHILKWNEHKPILYLLVPENYFVQMIKKLKSRSM